MTHTPLTPGFMVIHGNQPELLRQLLVDWLKAYPLAPLENEIMLVQSNGIAQWLKQALAEDEGCEGGGFGIATAIELTLPSRFIWKAYRAVLGRAEIPTMSPFDKSLLTWRLMRLLPQIQQQAVYAPLQRFLRQDDDLKKRFQLAERLADLFDQYQVYRADWLAAWAGQRDVLLDYHGVERPLAAEQAWQPALWRALQQDVGVANQTSRAAVHQRFLQAAAELSDRPVGFPRRLIVFGISALPKQALDVLQTIARWTQVVLCVNNQCEHFWGNILTEKEYWRTASKRHTLKSGMPETIPTEELHCHAHPLLAAWGKQGRDYIALLEELDQPVQYQDLFEAQGQRIDLFDSPGDGCLLNQLQDDFLNLRPLVETQQQWPAVDPAVDQSVRFHICHSPQREVEVLHDQLLAALDADSSLKPREIIVMVPDINLYAPHIQAVFGQIEPTDDRYMPFSIADIGKRQHSPLIAALEGLLTLNESRLPVSEVLDWLNVPALRQRFCIDEADLSLLQHWISEANIRWGLNSEHRQALVLHSTENPAPNTWQFGLQRMLLGYAVGSDTTGRSDNAWNDIEPYADIAGLDAALLGSLSQLYHALDNLLSALSQPKAPADWADCLLQLLQDFFQPTGTEERYLLLQLQESLQAWLEACHDAQFDEPLPITVVGDYWLSQIDQSGLSQRFLGGSLTFATLMPMRAIPFRRIYLLGMNDGAYPRIMPPLDFDLMAGDYRPGDRSRREDDRYLFLEALLSAREHFSISWVGRDIHDNSGRQPSVLVSQLRDHLRNGWRLENSEEPDQLLSALTVQHRLQPFSVAYFDGRDSRLFTYAREWRTAPSASPAVDHELAAPVFDAPLGLFALASFLRDPAKTFLRERLGVNYDLQDLAVEDQEPFALDPLENWALQDELIRTRLDAKQQEQDEAEAVKRQLTRFQRQGALPGGAFGTIQQTKLEEPLDALFEAYDEACRGWRERLPVLEIAFSHEVDGQILQVQDSLSDMFENLAGERCCLQIVSSNLLEKNGYRLDKVLGAWVYHLAGHLSGQPMTTLLISKNGNVTIKPLKPEEAEKHFTQLLKAYVAGLRQPTPLAAKTGFSWLSKQSDVVQGPLEQCDPKAAEAARQSYEGGYNSKGEMGHNPYLQRLFPSFEALWSDGAFSQACIELLKPLRDCVGESGKSKPGKSGGDQ